MAYPLIARNADINIMKNITKNKSEIYKKHRAYKKFLIQYMRQLKSNGCIVCGEKDQACLDFHHLHNKSFTIGNQCKDKGISSIKNEVDKCVVLCANCHRKLHFYNLTIDSLKDYVQSGLIPGGATKI